MDRVPKPELRVHGRWGSVSQCETVGDTESSQRILRLTIPLHLEVDSSVKQWKAVLVGSSGSIHAAAASTSGPSVDLSVNISFKVVRNEPLRESDWPRAEVRVTSTYLRREMSTKLAVVLPPGPGSHITRS